MPISQKLIDSLIEVLDALVRAEGPYGEKRRKILGAMTEEEQTNLEEFLSWFDKEGSDD